MQTKQLISTLLDSDYPLTLIASASGVSYYKMHRYIKGTGTLKDDEEARVRAFALVQPIIAAKGKAQ